MFLHQFDLVSNISEMTYQNDNTPHLWIKTFLNNEK
jgi:hypothetical protein